MNWNIIQFYSQKLCVEVRCVSNDDQQQQNEVFKTRNDTQYSASRIDATEFGFNPHEKEVLEKMLICSSTGTQQFMKCGDQDNKNTNFIEMVKVKSFDLSEEASSYLHGLACSLNVVLVMGQHRLGPKSLIKSSATVDGNQQLAVQAPNNDHRHDFPQLDNMVKNMERCSESKSSSNFGEYQIEMVEIVQSIPSANSSSISQKILNTTIDIFVSFAGHTLFHFAKNMVLGYISKSKDTTREILEKSVREGADDTKEKVKKTAAEHVEKRLQFEHMF